uniref:Uncharacterized protein n=1 Tax=Ditylenchus dipsaci TaxID=166011 RepID=A0A915DWK0_9BILA
MIKPVVLVPCLSGVSAAPIFTLGALSHAINWPVLRKELDSEQFRQAINEIPGCDWIDRVEQDPMLTELFEFKEKRLMWILMDYFTSLVEYPVPCEPKLVRSIIAEEDAYVLNHERVPGLTDIWPGASVQIVEKMGHVQGYLMNHHLFRQAIVDQLKLLSNLQSGLSTEP